MSQIDTSHQQQPSRSHLLRTPIRTLPPHIVERIAAGEVIERPVSAVKELLENAFDAGATDIRVEIHRGGLRLIRIADNGCGILADELDQACTRHTTSKIGALADLGDLHTLGFRGEALASIAAISEVTLLSRPIESEENGEEQAAAFITLLGGELMQRGQKARMHGTTATVRDLFYNVPARLKFMREPRTEAGYILQLVRRYAIGYPAVRFNLVIDERDALQTGGSGNLATTLAELYHLPLAEMLIPLSASRHDRCDLHGYIGNRALAQASRRHITLFVNGRWIHSRPLQDALEAGYRALLPKGKHPLLVCYLDLPPSDIDANVHPAKTEVRLLHESEITTVLTQAVRSVLERSPLLPETVHFPGPELLYQRHFPGARRRGLRIAENGGAYHPGDILLPTSDVLKTLHPLAQLQRAVILAEAPDGSLYLIDQHRAHERIIYEHLRNTHLGTQTEQTQYPDANLLLEPVIVELKRHEAALFEQRLPLLRNLGLECERFGGRSFLIRSVPGDIGQEQVAGHLHEIATVAAEDSPEWQDHLLIGLACRSALRRGRELATDEQRSLLIALADTAAPAVCPHGSPILLQYTRSFLVNTFEW